MLGNFGKAEEILTSIENQFGVSFWLVKTKISFLQHTRGLEAQKEYTKHIVERGCRNGFLAFSSHEYSISIEPAASIGNFAERMERAISQNYPSCFKTFWSYHLLLSLHLTQQQINEMLRMESSGAVIDLYETLISTGQISLNLEYFDLATEINRILTKLNISDGRTGIINWLATDSLPPTISHHKATRLFFEGDYDQAHETAILELKDNPASIDLIDIAARSAAICKKDIVKSESPLSTIISGLMKVILYSDPDRIDGKNLLKFALSFAPAGWASFVCSLLLRQLSNKPNSDISGLLPLSIISCNEVGLFSAKYMITSGHKNKYYQLFKKTHNEDFLDCYFGTCKLGECKKLPSLEAKYICLINKIINEKYDEAIRIAEEFLTKNNSNQNSFDYYRIKGLRAKAFALFTNGNLIECTEFITNTLASEYNLLDLFPVKSLVESFDKQLLNDNAANISISIVHDIYHKEVDQKLEHLRRYSYLDFLEAHKIKRPSQLREIENNFDKKELIYFLQFLCVEQNMDLAFSGSEQVAKERAAVCKYLTELCPSETETYQSEIKDIYRQLMVKKKAHEVEKSKIYVDLTSLKMEARKDFKEKYDRYKSYLSEGLDEKSFEYLSKLRETVKDRDTKTIFGLKAPDNEMTSVATSLITGLRDIFVSNTQHGLDGYLCVRIRHNTLPAKLRGPLETESLITNVDSNTQKYKENNALFEKLNVHDPSLKAGLVNCFNDFANKYDSLLKKINKEWIQVKTNSDETGLFDLTLYRPHIGLITSQIEEDTSFDEFVDTVFEVFF
ncbi:hypothetical protein [Salidesulfovibrio brasiliensis]|uniref:hypothetical protein n=1 Tax=Salidesulfovibrio brasiliensis TaxID=221711 RepID=UPI0012EEA207|nr:hypothetical protein [Salidesulfovibrio brasiliensis]